MQIRLGDLKENEIVPVQGTYNPKELELEFVDLEYSRPLSLDGTLEKSHDTLRFMGVLTSDVVHTCGRCLKKIPGSLRRVFDLFYETHGKEIIETTDDLREILILDHPLSYLCQESCRGLCPKCGINLNEAKCSCKLVSDEQPLSHLKDIWNKKKQESK